MSRTPQNDLMLSRQTFKALLVCINSATSTVLEGFLEKCGLDTEDLIDTPSQLEMQLAESETCLVFFGAPQHEATDRFVRILSASRSRQPCEVIVIADRLDEAALRLAIHVKAFEVLASPIDMAALMSVFQKAYKHIDAQQRSLKVQAYVAESLRILAAMPLSFGRTSVDGAPEAYLDLSRLAGVKERTDTVKRQGHVESEGKIALVDRLVTMATMRRKKFGDTFSDPGWEIVLDLYRHSLLGEAVSVTSACLAASVPASTAMRRISQLEECGLLQRFKDAKDGRRVLLDLTPSFKARLEEYFADAEAVIDKRGEVGAPARGATRTRSRKDAGNVPNLPVAV